MFVNINGNILSFYLKSNVGRSTADLCAQMYDLFSIFAQRSSVEYRHMISGTRSSEILPFMVTNVGKDETFPAYSCFSTIDSFRFKEIVSGNGAFQEILII